MNVMMNWVGFGLAEQARSISAILNVRIYVHSRFITPKPEEVVQYMSDGAGSLLNQESVNFLY